jgi:flagellar protein FliO/FliZ
MSTDWGVAARFLVALAVVLALIAGATWFARRYLGPGLVGNLGGKRRLSVVEYAVLDGKSRLVLVRRDTTEHLLVLGPTGAVVVEAGIPGAAGGEATRGGPAKVSAITAPHDAPRRSLRTLLTGRP